MPSQRKHITTQFNSNMHKMGPFEDGPIMVVAISGGADSLALSYLADDWLKSMGGRLIAVTIDHRLRAESEAESKFVQALMHLRNIEHHTLVWEHEAITENISLAAREARYSLLLKFCQDRDILHLLVAHHLNDQAETVYMRLQRGSGVDGLTAMSAMTLYHNICILRPLLNITKCQIVDYLQSHGAEWVEDPSNSNEKYDRVMVRKYLQNCNSLFSKRLVGTAQHMARAKRSLEESTARLSVLCHNIYPAAYAIIDLLKYRQMPEEEALRLLVSNLMTISGAEVKPRFESVKNLYAQILTGKLGKTLHGCMLRSDGQFLCVMREQAKISTTQTLVNNQEIIWDKRFAVQIQGEGYYVTKFTAILKNQLKKISPHLFKFGIPGEVLLTLPIIMHKDEIVAVPQLSYYAYPELEGKIKCYFKPFKALAIASFELIL
jgi:tRNA(Ile)-lysidine synthase